MWIGVKCTHSSFHTHFLPHNRLHSQTDLLFNTHTHTCRTGESLSVWFGVDMTRLSCPLPCCGFARCRPFSIFRPSGIMCLKSHPLCVCVCVCPVLVFNVCATAITLFPPLSRSLMSSYLGVGSAAHTPRWRSCQHFPPRKRWKQARPFFSARRLTRPRVLVDASPPPPQVEPRWGRKAPNKKQLMWFSVEFTITGVNLQYVGRWAPVVSDVYRGSQVDLVDLLIFSAPVTFWSKSNDCMEACWCHTKKKKGLSTT